MAEGYLERHPDQSERDAKSLGAFYTDSQVADFLAWWAIRSRNDRALDPCFGGGIFLRAACERLIRLGADVETTAFGVEIDSFVHGQISAKLREEFGLRRANLKNADFFAVERPTSGGYDAVIGNPPYIRYQRFAGEARRRALAVSEAEGVRLPDLCSSWAPFLVHCSAQLRQGGRLALVLPNEITYAKYARPVLAHLRRSFAATTLLTFRKKLFPDLSEDTLLLLAEDKGSVDGKFSCRELEHAGQLTPMREGEDRKIPGVRRLDAASMASGESRLIEQTLPDRVRSLYRRLKSSKQVERLGDLGEVGIGYVTGANDFFHLAPDEAARRRIPQAFLRPALKRGRALHGVRFGPEDWNQAVKTNEAAYLLHLSKADSLPASVKTYLREGEASGVDQAYKCRVRSPWYAVPHVHRADAFLSYMSGAACRLVANHAGAVAPNSLHVLRLRAGERMTGNAVAALWRTSLVRLSVEVEGHALGGGMLKLEPSEAAKVVLPRLDASQLDELEDLAEELDSLSRRSDDSAVEEVADRNLLQGSLGLTEGECKALRSAADSLRNRRMRR